MKYWSQLYHFYQPPTQTHDIIVRASEESYRPMLDVLLAHPSARVAININAVLTQLLCEHGCGDVVARMRTLSERGQVEFVGTGAFHPILPLIPTGLRMRSIEDNRALNTKLLGTSYAPVGFFPPEMCISDETLDDIRAAGHSWVIASGIASPGEWPISHVHPVEGTPGLTVVFRDDVRSNRIAFGEIEAGAAIEDIANVGNVDHGYVVTSMDGETFGHHIKGWERRFLDAAYTQLEAEAASGNERVRMVQPQELIGLVPAGRPIQPRASSWSTTADDIQRGNPFPLWNTKGNPLHEAQWKYVGHVLALAELAETAACTDESRTEAKFADERLQPALHSCQFWWASRSPWWNPMMIHRGLLLLQETLFHAARAIELSCADDGQKEVVRWRVASANESRAKIERLLFLEPIA